MPPLPLSPGLWAAALSVSVSGGRLCPRCRFADRPQGPRTSPASLSQGPEAHRPPAALVWEAGLQAPYPGQVCGARKGARRALPAALGRVAALTASPGGPDAEQKAFGLDLGGRGDPRGRQQGRLALHAEGPEKHNCGWKLGNTSLGGCGLLVTLPLDCISLCACVPARVGGIVMVLVQKIDWGY